MDDARQDNGVPGGRLRRGLNRKSLPGAAFSSSSSSPSSPSASSSKSSSPSSSSASSSSSSSSTYLRTLCQQIAPTNQMIATRHAPSSRKDTPYIAHRRAVSGGYTQSIQRKTMFACVAGDCRALRAMGATPLAISCDNWKNHLLFFLLLTAWE